MSSLNTNISSTTPVGVKGTLSVNSAVTVAALDLVGGVLSGPADLRVGNILTWTGGTMSGLVIADAQGNTVLTIAGLAAGTMARDLALFAFNVFGWQGNDGQYGPYQFNAWGMLLSGNDLIAIASDPEITAKSAYVTLERRVAALKRTCDEISIRYASDDAKWIRELRDEDIAHSVVGSNKCVRLLRKVVHDLGSRRFCVHGLSTGVHA